LEINIIVSILLLKVHRVDQELTFSDLLSDTLGFLKGEPIMTRPQDKLRQAPGCAAGIQIVFKREMIMIREYFTHRDRM
jgi:hypothetical protein